MSPVEIIDVTVTARPSRWLKVVMFLLRLGRRVGWRPDEKRQDLIVNWLIERSHIEVLERRPSTSPRPQRNRSEADKPAN